MDKLNELIDSYKEDMIRDLQTLVRIPSVQAPPLEGKPFGEACDAVLKAALQIAGDLGFPTENVDGYAGHVDYGEGDKTLGILAHLDVVPEGDGWTFAPYAAEIQDGFLYGRGSTDNKCSAVGSLYALKAVREAGIPIKDKVRIILGLNEESGWEDIAYYKTKYAMPDYGYSPDGPFPLVYAEKGILSVELKKEFGSGTGKYPIRSMAAGTALNVVPETCTVVLGASDITEIGEAIYEACEEKGFEYNITGNGKEVVLTVEGKAAHGASPDKGINAVTLALGVLRDIGAGRGSRETIVFLADHLQTDGEGLNIQLSDEPSKALTMNLGLFELNEEGFRAGLDIRQPVTYGFDEVVSRIQAACAPLGIEAEEKSHKDPLHLPIDHPLITTLMRIYKDITGRDDQPLSMGGGTYARALKNAVAFGPGFPDGALSKGAHERDERLNLDEWFTATKIYANAIAALAGESVAL